MKTKTEMKKVYMVVADNYRTNKVYTNKATAQAECDSVNYTRYMNGGWKDAHVVEVEVEED